MSESQAETFSPHNIIVLFGLLLAAVFIGEVLIGSHHDKAPMAAAHEDTSKDIAMRLQPVVTLDEVRANMTAAAGAGAAADKSPQELYQGACAACHGTGAAGAPKLGDAAAWAPRREQGLDTLVNAAINGIGAMPPRGGSQYSDDQIRSIVEYILSESK